ncbi:MAG TPA: beta-ketoacyl synthase N-terminal-like domain-containing protein [Bacteroidia bacterium]|jgi:3-oxoacyl-[acyl-carrier-protein] synthase II|nr:beta-ketoacyl synthase N-terminal-like domain-containing protein [Bacteroidia bacterium]
MKVKGYITGSGCISPQNTTEKDYFFENVNGPEVDFFKAIEPSYKEHINSNLLRRMGRAIKMGVSAARIAMTEAGIENVDAIISGTGLGCFEDTEKFLLAIINNDETLLTPTSFIQSTHNTVGSQVALIMKCHGYNYTYAHRGFSFDTCVMDALMNLEEGKNNILIGGIEEHTPNYVEIFRKGKKLNDNNSNKYFEGKTSGIQLGEGTTFFVLSNEKKNAVAAIDGVAFLYKPQSAKEVADKANSFLKTHNISLENIDLVLFGFSGDKEFDKYLLEMLPSTSKNSATAQFKHLSGEYYTANAFAIWTANKIIENQKIPDVIRINSVSKSNINLILIVNGFQGINYSFTLITKC